MTPAPNEDFRLLMERKITVAEYVERLKQRVALRLAESEEAAPK